MIMEVETALCRMYEQSQAIVTKLERAVEENRPIHQFEEALVADLRALGRSAVEAFIERQGDGDVGAVVEQDGHPLKRLPDVVCDLPEPQNKRLRANLSREVNGRMLNAKDATFGWLRHEAGQRNPHGKKTVVCIMDGETKPWDKQQEMFPEAVGVLDMFHVMEHLWPCVHRFEKENSLEELRFFEKQSGRILEGGIGGVVEGACRNLVKDRMERTGIRWRPAGAQAILDLRTVYLNDDWSAFHKYLIPSEQERLYPNRHRLIKSFQSPNWGSGMWIAAA